MNNEQKAQRLDLLAAEMEHADNGAADAALLRECAAMMWGKLASPAEWTWRGLLHANYKGFKLRADVGFWDVHNEYHRQLAEGTAASLEAAQAAAVAWCDAQEGE